MVNPSEVQKNNTHTASTEYDLKLPSFPENFVSIGDILFILAHIMLMLNHLVMSDFCNPTDCSPPVSSVHGISQERILQ